MKSWRGRGTHIEQIKMALLAPVPEVHLTSGLETQESEGRVAFGCDVPELLAKLQTMLSGDQMDVFIYASSRSLPVPAVTWRAIFLGHKLGINGSHPDGMKYRPKTAAGEKWNSYWEVGNLKLWRRGRGRGEAERRVPFRVGTYTSLLGI